MLYRSSVIFAAAILLASLFSLNKVLAAESLSIPIMNLSNTSDSSDFPRIAVEDTYVYVVWRDFNPAGSENPGTDILLRISKDEASFGEPVSLTRTKGITAIPDIAASGSNVYLAWSAWSVRPNLEVSNTDIFFTRSTDNGTNFGEILNLSDNPGSSGDPIPPTDVVSIATSGDSVYVVWRDNSNGNQEIFFRASHDGGATFGKIINLSNSSGFSSSPDVVSSGTNVYVVWHDETLGNYDIFFRKSTDRGKTFDELFNLSKNARNSVLPQIAVSDKNVYVAWDDFTTGSWNLYLRASTDEGSSFGDITNVTNNLDISLPSDIAASGNNVYVVWKDIARNSDIFIKAGIDNGSLFSKRINLSNTTGISEEPELDAYGYRVYLIWQDNTPNKYCCYDIFYKWVADDSLPVPSFVKSEVLFEGNQLEVYWSMQSGKVLSMEVDKDSKSVRMKLDRSELAEDNLLIVLPKKLIDVGEDKFTVIIDGKEVAYEVSQTSEEVNGLVVPLLGDTTNVQIIGKYIMPEYPHSKVEPQVATGMLKLNFNDKNYDIPYTIVNGTLKNVSIDELGAIRMGMDARDHGRLEISLPLEIIPTDVNRNLEIAAGRAAYLGSYSINYQDLEVRCGYRKISLYFKVDTTAISVQGESYLEVVRPHKVMGNQLYYDDRMPVVGEGKEFEILTRSQGTVCNLEFIKEEKKLSVLTRGIEGTQTSIHLTIPRELLDGEFKVTVDGNNTDFKIEQTKTTSSITIDLDFPYKDRRIDITGTQVIPEFPAFGLVVFTVAISIILATRLISKLQPFASNGTSKNRPN